MREIVLDTETTGLNPRDDRVIEIGCIELSNHVPTGSVFHSYINPKREIAAEAFNVHGISAEFLMDKPEFSEVAVAFNDFIGAAPLVIHNAAFDLGFINSEFDRIGFGKLPPGRAIDTLMIARRKFPGGQNSLDGLCRRFAIDISARALHGALLDAELLAEVYLELVGGRQRGLALDVPGNAGGNAGGDAGDPLLAAANSTPGPVRQARARPLSSRISEEEGAAHKAFIATLRGDPIWNR